MTRLVIGLLVGVVTGAVATFLFLQHLPWSAPLSGISVEERKPLYYRNPMNPAVTSPVPATDDVGMQYLPVYADDHATGANQTSREVLFYHNPMNPEITSPVPAKDEMGMDYIPVYADGTSGGGEKPGTVEIDPQVTQNIGVRTAEVVRGALSHPIRTVGRVVYDEQGLRRLHPKTEGWIEDLFVDETGVAVARDTILLSLYSPQLVATQQEYLLALRNREIFADNPIEDIRTGGDALIASARERLRMLDVPEHQIRELEQTRKIKKSLHIHSPYRGIVVNIGAREGQYVTAQTELYMIADLSRVWVYAEIYENDLPWVEMGDAATMTVAGIPDQVFTGTVTYIYPYLESTARTVRVRIEFDNPDLKLKPDMYTEVNIATKPQIDALLVPDEAIVRSGEREIVFIDLGGGKFDPREVSLGVSAGGQVQVTAGLRAGERVVTSGQFLIDSESKLREATAKMLQSMNPSAAASGVSTTGDPANDGSDIPGGNEDTTVEMPLRGHGGAAP